MSIRVFVLPGLLVAALTLPACGGSDSGGSVRTAGAPKLTTAIAFSRMTTAFGGVRRHYAGIMAAGRAVLIVMGVLVYTGELFQLNIEAQKLLDRIGINFFQDV